MAGAAMNRITTPSMSKLRISPPAKELCWECLLSSQGWPQQFKECLTPLSCWLTGPDGVPATRPYGALACAPLVWRPQIAFSLYEFGLLALRPGVIGQRELHAMAMGLATKEKMERSNSRAGRDAQSSKPRILQLAPQRARTRPIKRKPR